MTVWLLLRAIATEYINGLTASLQGFIVLHKIDNPPRNIEIDDKRKRLQSAVNSHQTVLENRRQREHDKKFGKVLQCEIPTKNSTPWKVVKCVFVNIASVLLVLLLKCFMDMIGPSFFSRFIEYLGSFLFNIPILILVRPLSNPHQPLKYDLMEIYHNCPFYILWFADIAGAAAKYRGQFGQKIPDLSHAASDFVHAIFLEFIVLLIALIIISIEIRFLSIFIGSVYMSLLHSLYSFDYIWMSNGITLNSRIALIERRWPFHLGFGTLLTLGTSYSTNFIINGCIFGALFPFFIISSCLTDANRASELSGHIPPIRFFGIAQSITNKLSVTIFGRIC